MTLTNSHLGKYIWKVLLKPLPTFGWLRHVLTVLQTQQCKSSYSFRKGKFFSVLVNWVTSTY